MSEEAKNKLADMLAQAKHATPAAKTEDQETKDNVKKVIKSSIMSIVQAYETIKAEQEAIKDIAENLKAQHGIETKVSKKVAKIVSKGEHQKHTDETNAIDELLELMSKP
jgi:hypothetical protein